MDVSKLEAPRGRHQNSLSAALLATCWMLCSGHSGGRGEAPAGPTPLKGLGHRHPNVFVGQTVQMAAQRETSVNAAQEGCAVGLLSAQELRPRQQLCKGSGTSPGPANHSPHLCAAQLPAESLPMGPFNNPKRAAASPTRGAATPGAERSLARPPRTAPSPRRGSHKGVLA